MSPSNQVLELRSVLAQAAAHSGHHGTTATLTRRHLKQAEHKSLHQALCILTLEVSLHFDARGDERDGRYIHRESMESLCGGARAFFFFAA
jgi:hypothetical protein